MIYHSKLKLPFLTARQLLQSRRRFRNSIRRGKEVAESCDLLEQINDELQSRRDLSFQNPARRISPPYKSRPEFKGENMKNMFNLYDDFVAKMLGKHDIYKARFGKNARLGKLYKAII